MTPEYVNMTHEQLSDMKREAYAQGDTYRAALLGVLIRRWGPSVDWRDDMKHVPIEGSDLKTITPVNGQLMVAGIIHSPHDLISIKWEVDNASGSTKCLAWEGQYKIDQLTLAGYRVLSIERHH